MTQQEFEHIYSSIKADLMRLAGQFCRSTSLDLDAEDAVQEAFIAFWAAQARQVSLKWQMSVSSSNGSMTR